jgi:glyoxylase-like metal-dependent hydrolase (beta-lactamase superfamily II)
MNTLPRSLSRRLTLVFTLTSSLLCGAVWAANTPKVATQAPGYYRMVLGDFEVTTLLDGTFQMPVDKLLTGLKPEQLQKLLTRSFETGVVPTSVNGFLVNTGTKLVLIDTGTGGLMGPSVGHLLANLKASGYRPEQVDEIYITHMHPDHIGGLTLDGKRAFPNALVRVSQLDKDFYLNPATMEKEQVPEKKANFVNAAAAFKPYLEAGKFKTFDGETELVPGIKEIPLSGHTPGHTGYVVESKGNKLVLLGDLLHVAAVQFSEPSATMAFDTDAKSAVIQRKKVFEQAAKEGYIIGSAHLSFPGMGHVRREAKSYAFVPLDYVAMN